MRANTKPLGISHALAIFLSINAVGVSAIGGVQEPLGPTAANPKYKIACPDYKNYAMRQQYVHPMSQSL